MFPDIPQPFVHQPQLITLDDSVGTIELFPAIWKSLEDLTREDEQARAAALDQIAKSDAHRFSPLVNYLLYTRITEPILPIRAQVIQMLSQVLLQDEHSLPSPEDVRNSLRLYLSSLRTRKIYALLQVSAEYGSHESYVALLLKSCSFGGNHLVDILNERGTPYEIRKQAALMIGMVGYLYTLPAMEKISGRMEAHLAGQSSMGFLQNSDPGEADLLPVVLEAINSLKSH